LILINLIEKKLDREWEDFYNQKGPFDTEASFSNLVDIMKLLKEQGVVTFIIFGTLLGFVRNGELIKHDKDVDIGFFDNDLMKLINSHHKLMDAGFRLLREDYNSELISYERGGQYVDLYKFSHHSERPVNASFAFYFPGGCINPINTLKVNSEIIYLPHRSKYLLRKLYGLFYFIEIKDNHYPNNKFLLKIINYSKMMFPRLYKSSKVNKIKKILLNIFYKIKKVKF